MQISSIYLSLYIAALALPLAVSADNSLSFAGLGADVDQVVHAPVKAADTSRPAVSTNNSNDDDDDDDGDDDDDDDDGDDDDDDDDDGNDATTKLKVDKASADNVNEKVKMDTSNEQQQQQQQQQPGRVLKSLLDRIRDQIPSTPLLKQGVAALSVKSYPTAKQINPNAGDRALVTALKTPASLTAVLYDQSPLSNVTPVSAKSPSSEDPLTETTNGDAASTANTSTSASASVSNNDKTGKDGTDVSSQTAKKGGKHKHRKNKYDNEEPIYCSNGSYYDGSLVIITHPQVPFSKARALCRSQGMDLALADVSVGNFVESTSLAFRCSGAFSATWIRSYNGDTHEHACLALFTGAAAPGGSVNIPDSCKKHLPTLCKEI